MATDLRCLENGCGPTRRIPLHFTVHGAQLGAWWPPKEIRIEVLTENLAAARARHQAKIDRYIATGMKGRAPGPVKQNSKVERVKAALDRAIAEQAAKSRANWPRPQWPTNAYRDRIG